MLVYGHGCYETAFSVADGKAKSDAGSLDLFTLWKVFLESADSHGQPEVISSFIRSVSTNGHRTCFP